MQIFRGIIYPFKWIIHHPVTFLFVLITQGLQIAGVALIAMSNNRIAECILIYFGMVVARNLLGGGFHAKSYFVCTVTTWAIFYFLTSAVPPIYVTIYTSLCFGVGIALIMYHLDNYLKLLVKNKEKVNAINDIEIIKVDKSDKTE